MNIDTEDVLLCPICGEATDYVTGEIDGYDECSQCGKTNFTTKDNWEPVRVRATTITFYEFLFQDQ